MGKLLSNKKIRPLFIGFGNQALAYADVFKFLKIKISGVCVKNLNKNISNLKKYQIQNVFQSIDKSLASNCYNCVFVFLPWDQIEQKIIGIIKKTNKVIFCEKPLALSYKKILEIKRNSNKYNKKLFILYNRRYYNTLNFLEKKKQLFLKSQILIPEKKKKLIKLFGKTIIGKIKYHYTSHWVDYFNLALGKKINNIKKIKNYYQFFYKNNSNVNFKLTYSEKKTIIAKFYTQRKIYKLVTLEKLYVYSKNKKRYFIKINENTQNKFKPGILKLVNSILKNKINKLRKIDSLIFDYKILQKLPY
jgi:hypothetical protein